MQKPSKGFFNFFINSFIVTSIVLALIFSGSIWAYQKHIYVDSTDPSDPSNHPAALTTAVASTQVSTPVAATDIEEVNKTVAVLGTDAQGYRTDVIIVANYNSITGKINLVSIPRDTRVEWTQAQKTAMRKQHGYTMSVTKINEMSSYTGIDNIDNYALAYIENLLGIQIDNYVIVSLTAFREIVDAVGGVYIDVPIDMYYYDPIQALYIDLKAGPQLLDGVKAEQFVRYRSMPGGDVDRIKMQQLFLEAFADKVLSPSIILKIPNLIQILFSSIKTDISITEIFQYYGYLKDFSLDNLHFYTLPGKGQYIGHISYFIPDMAAIEDFSKSIFFEHVE
ncbi:LCP family protein [Candidatus Epulonipiscium viviparus]|uniref:LCP family protein n=1 Tax=Candidatus Epulonipiscium viviparus TaxID=420336 RepID=UPI002738086C|nr:LCP family protein [Candidatus Epulopiscium viviparus]